MTNILPKHARVVIIGGGMMGVGLLYHIAEAGWDDCVLIEKGELTSGSTWHAAGQCPSFIADYNMAQIHHYSNTLYPKLEELTGQATSWHACGGIRFATTEEELDYFRLVEGIAANIGYRMQIISPKEIRRINPFLITKDVLAGAWTLDDGHVDPAGCCNAMAKASENYGAVIIRNNRVTDTNLLSTGEWEIVTQKGTIVCEHVVNAGGCYAARIGSWVGLDLPITNMKHQYVVTEPIQAFMDLDEELPIIRDPYSNAYFRQEQKSGLIGIYERSNSREAWFGSEQSWEAESELFSAELDPILPWLERVMERMPIYRDAGIRRVVHGAISHTPDSNPLVGPTSGLQNYWLCTGSSIGIAQGGGCGKYLAQWIMHGAAEINMIGLDPRRFGDYATTSYTTAKSHREYQDMYDLLLPGEERMDGRPGRTSPIHKKLLTKGGIHTEAMGWERPKWFSLDGQVEEHSFRRNNIFEVVAAECAAVRERVGILDLSSFSKYEVSGSDAEAFLNRICANKVSRRKDGIVLSHPLSESGLILGEFTITRLAFDRYYLLSAASSQVRDFDILNFSKLDTESVTIRSLTEDYGTLVLAGPSARELMTSLTSENFSNAKFPWLTGKEIVLAGVEVIALRINYLGELGWELHTPMEHLQTVYNAAWTSGDNFGIADFGVYAVNSLRMEKAYKAFGLELTNEITMIEAGMERFINFEKGDFIGRKALLQRQKEQLKWNIAYVEVDADDADVFGGEPAYDGDKVIGVTTSGSYGHTVNKSLAFVYVPPEYAKPGTTFDIEILSQRRQVKVLAEPAYDPKNRRLRA